MGLRARGRRSAIRRAPEEGAGQRFKGFRARHTPRENSSAIVTALLLERQVQLREVSGVLPLGQLVLQTRGLLGRDLAPELYLRLYATTSTFCWHDFSPTPRDEY